MAATSSTDPRSPEVDLHQLQQHDVLDPAPDDDVAAKLYVPRQDLDGSATHL